jgi:hypothetical protein
MAGSRSKTKGNTAERALCKIFEGVFGGSFQRVFTSGAFTGGKNAYRRNILSDTQVRASKGDIITPDHLPGLVLESKHYKDFPYHNLITPGAIPLLDKWIDQTLDAVDPGDFWMLAFKADRREWSAAFPAGLRDQFELTNFCTYTAADGRCYIVTHLKTFIAANKVIIERLSNPLLQSIASLTEN